MLETTLFRECGHILCVLQKEMLMFSSSFLDYHSYICEFLSHSIIMLEWLTAAAVASRSVFSLL